MEKIKKTDYDVLIYLALGFFTLGIYPIIVRTKIGVGLNKITNGTGAKKTMNFCLVYFLLGPITLSIALFVWFHKISDKMEAELKRRNIDYKFSSVDFWLWNNLASLILVGPIVYLHKMFKAFDLLATSYNEEIDKQGEEVEDTKAADEEVENETLDNAENVEA